MGARLRLKAAKDISGFAPGVQKIFRAMKTYGLIVADNGTDMYIGGTWDDRWDNDVLNPAFDAADRVRLRGRAARLDAAARAGARRGRACRAAPPNGNGVLEPGESAVVAPCWQGSATEPPSALTGVAAAFGGPAGATYALDDASAAYGSPAADAPASCWTPTGNCYRALGVRPRRASRGALGRARFTRPSTGRRRGRGRCTSAAASPTCRRRTPSMPPIETLFHDGVTAGCGHRRSTVPTPASRGREMAVFLLKAKLGPDYAPPAGIGHGVRGRAARRLRAAPGSRTSPRAASRPAAATATSARTRRSRGRRWPSSC